MNKVVLIGRLAKDPDLKFTPGNGTAVASTTIAVDRYNNKTQQHEADFIPVVVWGKQGENLANYVNKGGMIAISGRIQTRSYDAKDGTKRYITEVVADMVNGVQFLGNKNGNNINQDNGSNNFGNMNQDTFGNGNFNCDTDITPVDYGDAPF